MGYVNSSHDNVLSMGLPAEKVQGTGVRRVYPAVLRADTASDVDDSEEGEKPVKGLVQQIKESLSISPSPSPKTVTPRLADFAQTSGYLNPQAGWGEATRSCQLLIDHLRSQGVTFIPGKEVCGMTFDPCLSSRGGRKVTGVRFADGEEMAADLVVVAAGAWTPGLFAQKGMGGLPGVIAAG
jgi:glycine/D-amino acid oxidase-like deaminating enzyme